MNYRVEFIKTYIASMIALLSGALGEDLKYFRLLLAVMLFDTALGWLKAIKLDTWKSKLARLGFSSKLVELALVGLMYKLDYTLGLNFLMRFAIFYYIVIELASIIENIHEGKLARIPDGLLELTRELKKSVDKTLINKIKDKFFKD